MGTVAKAMGFSAALLLAGCASGSGVYGADSVDTPPRLYGCPNVTDAGAGQSVDVTLTMVVDEEGKVVPGTIRHRPGIRSPNPRKRAPEGLVREASALALDCMFAPATVAGEPVRVQVEHTIKFAFNPTGS